MRADRENAIAVLVDIQEKLLPVMPDREELLRSCVNFIRGMRILSVPILAARQYPKGLGDLVAPVREALGTYAPYDKLTFSVYGSAPMREALAKSGRGQVFLFGIETHICVLQSAMDLQSAGYQVYLVGDCTAARRRKDHKAGLRRAEEEGALLTTREAAFYELLREAGSARFKEISNLVKEY